MILKAWWIFEGPGLKKPLGLQKCAGPLKSLGWDF
jgi:hypothetical protein